MPNIMKLMKQVNRMKEDLAKTQEALAASTLEYTAGGGAVTVTVTGSGKIQGVKIDPKAVDASDVSMLEDLLVTAIRGAQDMASEHAEAEMKKVTGGLNLPPEFGL